MKMTMMMLAALLAAQVADAKEYKIDPMHSSVSFSVKHLGISKTTGRFDSFSGTVDYDAKKPAAWKTQAEIDAASVNTQVEARDKHLRNADFLDVEKFPKLSFKSTKVAKGKLHGELTIHGVTRPVVLDLEINGTGVSPMNGAEIFGATAKGRINRRDFGVGTSMAAQMIGDEVDITLEIEAAAEKKS